MKDKLLYRIEGTKGNYSIWLGGGGYPWNSWQFGIKTKKECDKIIKRLKENE